MSELYVRNRQRTRFINLQFLKAIARSLLAKLGPGQYQLGVLLVGEREMIQLNETFLHHAGSTDVITFDYAAGDSSGLDGELVLCVDEAVRQAKRFRTSWQKELIRYLTHGLLHCLGHDDATPTQRRKMKVVENALVQRLAREFSLSQLSRQPKVRL